MRFSRDSMNGSFVSKARRHSTFLLGLVLAVAIIYHIETFLTEDIYASTPFCDADGTCHEKPDKASPRTIYSARSNEQYQMWWKCQENLNATAQSYAERRESEAKDGRSATRPLVLLGDSITESWLGMEMGRPSKRAAGVPAVLQELLANNPLTKMDPLILAISGDQTQHLLYRLEHGQLLPAYAEDPTSIFVVLIGTNNLGAGELPLPVSKGVLAVADYILSHTQGHLVLLQALPRGDSFRLARVCPPRCDSEGKPFRSYLPAIEKLNHAVQEGVQHLGEVYGSRRLGLVDCGKWFLSDDGSDVNRNLMPDSLHPNAAGHMLLGECFMSYIRGLEKG